METILFDVDDTLYDQLQPFQQAFHSVFPNLTDIPIEKLYVSSRRHGEQLFNKSERGEISLLDLHIHRITAAFRDFNIEIEDEKAVQFQKVYEKAQKQITIFPEIARLFDLLKENKKQMGILTNGPYQHQLMKVHRLGLTKWIPMENIFVSEAIGSAKPDPQSFQIVEQKMQIDKEKTVYIGDSFENDMIGAKRVGWSAIWLNHRMRKLRETSVTPDKIVHSPEELLKYVVTNYLCS
ncbi:HAD family hydrolase [Fervidibacillus halotolerans]|uniref:HAD family hydrolase n=1 Tax=Fervidibacillus halotolerans TaxID=2980027 RepID=A0A9E8RYT3_9BACI|nr:HAD family hydrolase [Fervidibacillus halotolerans]WAA13156.1 HAD family hydrolase [Fervidibacillus halotolerans]